MPALILAVDRGMAIPPGHVVRTGYVAVEQIVLGCREVRWRR
jgi:hypothetical protein